MSLQSTTIQTSQTSIEMETVKEIEKLMNKLAKFKLSLLKKTGLKLNDQEQRVLKLAKNKIKTINNNILNSKSLNNEEIETASKSGLIDSDQKYFWTEEWQTGMRESERDIKVGRVSQSYKSADELINYLDSLKYGN